MFVSKDNLYIFVIEVSIPQTTSSVMIFFQSSGISTESFNSPKILQLPEPKASSSVTVPFSEIIPLT